MGSTKLLILLAGLCLMQRLAAQDKGAACPSGISLLESDVRPYVILNVRGELSGRDLYHYEGQDLEEKDFWKLANGRTVCFLSGNGRISRKGGYTDQGRDGRWELYYDTGQLFRIEYYRANRIYSVDSCFSPMGSRRDCGTLKDGTGKLLEYGVDRVVSETDYVNGKIEGKMVSFDENGADTLYVGNYVRDTIHGREYSFSRGLARVSSYKMGVMHGEFSQFDESGRCLSKRIFSHGLEIRREIMDSALFEQEKMDKIRIITGFINMLMQDPSNTRLLEYFCPTTAALLANGCERQPYLKPFFGMMEELKVYWSPGCAGVNPFGVVNFADAKKKPQFLTASNLADIRHSHGNEVVFDCSDDNIYVATFNSRPSLFFLMDFYGIRGLKYVEAADFMPGWYPIIYKHTYKGRYFEMWNQPKCYGMDPFHFSKEARDKAIKKKLEGYTFDK